MQLAQAMATIAQIEPDGDGDFDRVVDTPDLAVYLGWTERDVERVLRSLERDGVPIKWQEPDDPRGRHIRGEQIGDVFWPHDSNPEEPK